MIKEVGVADVLTNYQQMLDNPNDFGSEIIHQNPLDQRREAHSLANIKSGVSFSQSDRNLDSQGQRKLENSEYDLISNLDSELVQF